MRILYTIMAADKIEPNLAMDWLGELPEHKRQQLQRLKQPEDRLRSLLAWQLLKIGVHAMDFPEFALLDVVALAEEKPWVNLPLDFSISHSEQLVVCALSGTAKVGVDTEHYRPHNTTLCGFMNADELRLIERDERNLMKFWSAKEAVVKAAGSKGIAAIGEVELHATGAYFEQRHWYVQPISLHCDYCTHVASDNVIDGIEYCEVAFPQG
ncbi:4'-phosphopantetheinyl transferase family protein [Kaarinaea lacus]